MNETTSTKNKSSRAAIAVVTTTSTAQVRVVLCQLATQEDACILQLFFQCVRPGNLCITTRNSTVWSRSVGSGHAHVKGQRCSCYDRCFRIFWWCCCRSFDLYCAASRTDTTGAQKPKASTFIWTFYVFTRNGIHVFYYSIIMYTDLPVFSYSNQFPNGPKDQSCCTFLLAAVSCRI